MSLLAGFRVVQIGPGLGAAVCGRLLADAGAAVTCVDPDNATPLAQHLNHGKTALPRDSAPAHAAIAAAALIVAEGRPSELRARSDDAATLRARNPDAAIVLIAPFGQTGPQAEHPASDLTLFYASGIARLLTGQVDDLAESPIRPVGEQSAFIAGVAAACAGMHGAMLPHGGAVIDVSMQEALATLAMSELARVGLTGKSASRKRLTDGNGATVCILPARDGYVAISPREDHQWASWLEVMGSPEWGDDPRFARKPDRVANWDALHALMSAWSRQHDKQWIADAAQQAHVPSFPLRELHEVLGSAQLRHRRFFRSADIGRRTVQVPGAPFGLTVVRGATPAATVVAGAGRPSMSFPCAAQQDVDGRAMPGHDSGRAKPGHDTGRAKPGHDTGRTKPGHDTGRTKPGDDTGRAQPGHDMGWDEPGHDGGGAGHAPQPLAADPAHESPRGPMPLSGVRVLDFSWVIAGPTTTRYLAAMGAEVIKVEAPGRGDPGRASELHTVLGQAKRSIVLDLKQPQGRQIARDLAARSDVLVENFATGVMDRLGLGAAALRAVNPNLIYLSASGLGRSGPESHAVAYGTLLQCYAGFAGLNRHPDRPPRVGFAWLDPMCGLMLAFSVAAALWQRRHGGGIARIDFSMIEAMLWTLADPLLATQRDAPPRPLGDGSDHHAPHGAWRCADDDAWVALAVRSDAEWRRLCLLLPALRPMAEATLPQRVAMRGDIGAVLAAWLAPQQAEQAAARLRGAGIAASALADSRTLRDSDHLRARGFWETQEDGVLPGLPWRASFGRVSGPAPALGADTDAVLRDVLGMQAGGG